MDAAPRFGHHAKIVEFTNGSIIEFRSVEQKTVNLASAHVHHILIDEPPPEDVWDESLARVRATGGTISLTLTPIGRECSGLKALCEPTPERPPVVRDLHFPLTEDNLRMMRSGRLRRTDAGQPMNADFLARERANTPPHTAGVRFDGDWETRVVDRLYEAFDRDNHVSAALPARKLKFALGIDHGTQRGNQAAILCAVDTADIVDGYPRVFVIGEAWSEGMTSSDQDVEAILAMLRSQTAFGPRGIEWADLDFVFGDIPTSNRGNVNRKGNYDLMDGLARKLKLRRRRHLSPQIATAKRGRNTGRGSVDRGESWLHRRFVADAISVHPECVHLIECLERYDGRSDSEYKHPVDALRYSLYEWIMRTKPVGPVGPIYRR